MNKIVCLCLLVLAAANRLSAQQYPNLVIEPELSKPGDMLSLRYDPKDTPLDTARQIAGVAYFFENTDYRWHARDLSLQKEGKYWTAKLPTDTNTAFVAYKFYSDTLVDNNNDSTYVSFMQNPKREGNARGTLIAWGLLRAPKLGRMIPGYIKELTISDTAAYLWFNQEFRFHGEESQRHLALPYAWAVHFYKGEEGREDIYKVLNYLKKQQTEKALLEARTISKDILKDQSIVDSLDQQLLARFPQGQIAKLQAYAAWQREQDMSAKMKIAADFLQRFPEQEEYADFDEANRIRYSELFQYLVIMRVMQKDYKVYNEYITQLPYESLFQLYYKTIDIMHKRKDVADSTLYPYSKMLIDRIRYFKDHQPMRYAYLSPLEWERQVENYLADNCLVTHVEICEQLGKDEEGIHYAELAQRHFAYTRAPLNSVLAILLDRSGNKKELDEVLVKSLAQNQASTEMLDLLKKRYQEEKGTLDGFDAYVATLKNTTDHAAGMEELKKKMIRKAMPKWRMRDLQGKWVSADEMKGKVLVLDFWATWCVPCKASFPGMKLAVEKYAQDPDVQFFFVDTEERGDQYPKQVAQYIQENHYPFDVLFDNQEKGAKTNSEVYKKICEAFGISGIPQKLFIDKEGNVRFISVGFNGSATALADEISAMVELTKSEK